MPITQARVIGLVQEAKGLLRFHEDLILRIRQQLQAAAGVDKETLVRLIETELAIFQRPHMEQTFQEEAHFRAKKSKNDYSRRYMQRKRTGYAEPALRAMASPLAASPLAQVLTQYPSAADPRIAKAAQLLAQADSVVEEVTESFTEPPLSPDEIFVAPKAKP